MKQKITFPREASILFLLCIFCLPSFAYNYVEIKPRSGDGMYNIFKKYKIPANEINIKQFKEINKPKRTDKLLLGVSYQLPILLMPYNGKSVTTSLNSKNAESVKRIINYNKSAFQQKLRKKPYAQTKIIWVPFHEVYNTKSLKTSIQAVTSQKAITISKSKSILISKPVIIYNKNLSESAAKKPEIKAGSPKQMDLNLAFQAETVSETAEVNNSGVLRTKTVPLFGPDFEEILMKSNELKNKVFYLVSGHGGPDPGTMYTGNNLTLCEDEYAYDVTLRLARSLMEHGATVHMIVQDPNDGIRNEKYLSLDHDEKCITGYPLVLNQRLRLTQTTDAVNDLYREYQKKGIADKNQISIHIHVDSQNKNMRKDVYFYYQEDSKTSLAIAKKIQGSLDNKYESLGGRSYKGTVGTRNLFVMRNTIPSTVFIELGNIQNTEDHKRLLISSNRQALAEWLYDGIAGE